MLPERRTAARTGLAALQLAPILVSVVWQASWVGLLLLPAIVWHVQGDQYRSRTCRRLIGGCALLVFVFGYVALTYGGVAWIGPLVALWARRMTSCPQHRRSRRRARRAARSASRP